MGPRAGLDAPVSRIESRHQAHSVVIILTELSQLLKGSKF